MSNPVFSRALTALSAIVSEVENEIRHIDNLDNDHAAAKKRLENLLANQKEAQDALSHTAGQVAAAKALVEAHTDKATVIVSQAHLEAGKIVNAAKEHHRRTLDEAMADAAKYRDSQLGALKSIKDQITAAKAELADVNAHLEDVRKQVALLKDSISHIVVE